MKFFFLVVLVHGKSMVKVFAQKFGISIKDFLEKTSKHDKNCYNLIY